VARPVCYSSGMLHVRHATVGVAGLKDRPRPGRPPRFTPVQTAHVKAIACTTPDDDKHLPLDMWSVAEVARQGDPGESGRNRVAAHGEPVA